MAKNNDMRADIEAIRKAQQARVEEIPFLVVGQVYSDYRNNEYLLTGQTGGRVELLRLKDEVSVSGPDRSLNGTTGRAPTAAEKKALARWEAKKAEETKVLVPGQVVKLTDERAKKAAAKSFPGKENGNFVVVKVSDKTVNIVPLGGHGNGLAYLRSPAALLTVVEL